MFPRDISSCLLAFAVLALMARPTSAESLATVLEPVTPRDQEVRTTDRPVVAIDATGRMLIVYQSKDADGVVRLQSALRTGAAWQYASLTLPPGAVHGTSVAPRDLVAGTASQGFHLLGSYNAKLWHWSLQGATWSQPQEIPPNQGSTSMASIGLTASGDPFVVYGDSRFHLAVKKGGAWQYLHLAPLAAQYGSPSIFPGPGGAQQILGLRRYVPIVASCAAGADPLLVASWTFSPDGDSLAWTTAIPTGASDIQVALDRARGRVVAMWKKNGKVSLGFAPVGTTSVAGWTVVDVPPGTGLGIINFRLVANGTGGVGVLTFVSDGSRIRALQLRWISAGGILGPVTVSRPATQTECAVFDGMASDKLGLLIAPSGKADVLMLGSKRGEVTGGTYRLYHATVSGGGTATVAPQPPGSVLASTPPSPVKPDFTVKIVMPAVGQGDRVASWANGTLDPRVEITNKGAQYWGDLVLEADLDGAKVRILFRDPTNHEQPLYKGGESRTYHLAHVSYLTSPGAPPGPRDIVWGSNSGTDTIILRTGLGRKKIAARIDAASAIDEADEKNNEAGADFVVYDGTQATDRARGADGKWTFGYNDLDVALPIRLFANTPLLKPGYVQKPTSAEVVVSNPRLAGYFPGATVVATLDGKEIGRRVLGTLDGKPNLVRASFGDVIIWDKVKPKPDLSGERVVFPVDLTNVAVGSHTLKVVVDPDDRFADLARANNTSSLAFNVRPPGGDLKVRVVDKGKPTTPVAGASVVLENLWFGRTDAQGYATIPDLPPGAYDGKALFAERMDPEPRYFEGRAPAHTVVAKTINAVTIMLERSLNIVGEVKVSGTSSYLDDEVIGAGVTDAGFHAGARVQGHRFTIYNLPPGKHTVSVAAYGYEPRVVEVNAQRPTPGVDDYPMSVSLVKRPRGTVTGRVLEVNGAPIKDATVWLEGAPRASRTDVAGAYRLENVAATEGDTVWADIKDHTTQSAAVPAVGSGQTASAPDIRLAKITRKSASVEVDATTWAMCEATPDYQGMPSIRIDNKFGAFKARIGLTYHETAGRPGADVDEVVLVVEGGPFMQTGVTSTLDMGEMTGFKVDQLKSVLSEERYEMLGKIITAVEDWNALSGPLFDAWMKGSPDPSQMRGNNQVTGTYSSQSGVKPEDGPMLAIPLTVSVPIGVSFIGGGTTVVRVDYVALSDGVNPDKVMYVGWLGPGFAVFNVGQHFDLSKLDVKLKVMVLNSNLDTGVLGTNARNQITWKPGQKNWVRFEGMEYQVNFE